MNERQRKQQRRSMKPKVGSQKKTKKMINPQPDSSRKKKKMREKEHKPMNLAKTKEKLQPIPQKYKGL